MNLYSGAIFIQQALRWNIYISIFALLTLTSICTIGRRDLIFQSTDNAQLPCTGTCPGHIFLTKYLTFNFFYENDLQNRIFLRTEI